MNLMVKAINTKRAYGTFIYSIFSILDRYESELDTHFENATADFSVVAKYLELFRATITDLQSFLTVVNALDDILANNVLDNPYHDIVNNLLYDIGMNYDQLRIEDTFSSVEYIGDEMNPDG